jgi:hypothetical protein
VGGCAAAVIVVTADIGSAALPNAPGEVPPCAVTRPKGTAPPVDLDPGWYGNGALATQLWMWGEGTVVIPPDLVQRDQALGPLKWAWYRHHRGDLSVEGRRLDAPAPPLRADVSAGYGDAGFQPVALTFPTAGCWEVTGRVGDARLTLVAPVAAP